MREFMFGVRYPEGVFEQIIVRAPNLAAARAAFLRQYPQAEQFIAQTSDVTDQPESAKQHIKRQQGGFIDASEAQQPVGGQPGGGQPGPGDGTGGTGTGVPGTPTGTQPESFESFRDRLGA